MANKKVGVFTVPGKPHGKERPMFNSKSKTAYTPQGQKLAEHAVWTSYYAAGYQHLEFDGVLRVDIVCCYAPPEKMPKEQRQAMIGKWAYNTGKGRKDYERREKLGDVDNCCKTILDGLQGAAYQNDQCVVQLTAVSMYAHEDCTRVRITVLEPLGGSQ